MKANLYRGEFVYATGPNGEFNYVYGDTYEHVVEGKGSITTDEGLKFEVLECTLQKLKGYKVIGNTTNDIDYLYNDEVHDITEFIGKDDKKYYAVVYEDAEFCITSTIICESIEEEYEDIDK